MKRTTKTKQKIEIRRLPYTRMLKSEMADYADRVIDIVQKHTSESSLFNPLFETLLAKESEIEMLRLSYGVDTERLKLENIKSVMMLTISSFKLKVRRVSKFNPTLDMHVIENAIDSYLRYFNRCRNDKELNQKIAGFLDLMNANKEFATAINKFNLIDYINEIKEVHHQYNEVLFKRVHLLAKRPKFSTQDIIKDVFDAIDNLFKAIEVAQLISNSSGDAEGSGADYTQLINKLRQLSDMYYKSYSIRKANNRRKRQEQQMDDADLELDLKESDNGSESSIEVEIPQQEVKEEEEEVVEVSNNGNEISDDIHSNLLQEDICESEFDVASSAEEEVIAVSNNGNRISEDIHPSLLQKEQGKNGAQSANAIDLNGDLDNSDKPDTSVKLGNKVKELATRRLLLGAGPPCNS